ncbi:MAG: hypothetical protein P4L55_05515 [Syntrophobacteraceae bacterium]|nr:hypothetical protein [Syntrophobacteraceae bacterium]
MRVKYSLIFVFVVLVMASSVTCFAQDYATSHARNLAATIQVLQAIAEPTPQQVLLLKRLKRQLQVEIEFRNRSTVTETDPGTLLGFFEACPQCTDSSE